MGQINKDRHLSIYPTRQKSGRDLSTHENSSYLLIILKSISYEPFYNIKYYILNISKTLNTYHFFYLI